MKLNTRLLFVLLFIILMPMLLVGFIAFSNAERVLVLQAANQVTSLTSTKESKIKVFVNSQKNIYKAIASRTKFRDLLTTYNEIPTEEAAQALQVILRDSQEPFSDLVWIAAFDAQGEYVTGTKEFSAEEHEDMNTFFSNTAYEFRLFFENQDDHIIVGGPIIRGEEFLGVLLFQSTSEPLVSLLTDYAGLGETGETLIARRDEFGNAQFLHRRRFENADTAVSFIHKDATHVPMTQALLKHENVFFDLIDYRGELVVAATAYISELDWGLVVKIDKQELFHTLADFKSTLIIFLTIILLVTLLIIYAVAESFTRPIVALTERAETIADGDFSSAVPESVLHETGELGKLAHVFQGMTKNLSQMYSTLEEKVEMRNVELHKKIDELEALNNVMIGREEKMIALKKALAKYKKHDT